MSYPATSFRTTLSRVRFGMSRQIGIPLTSVHSASGIRVTKYVVASGAAEITDPWKVVLPLSAVSRTKFMTDVVWAMVPTIRAEASKNEFVTIMGNKYLFSLTIRFEAGVIFKV